MNEPIIGLFSRSYEHATRGGDPGLEMFASPTKAFSGFLARLERYHQEHDWQGIGIAFKIVRELTERGKVAFVIQTVRDSGRERCDFQLCECHWVTAVALSNND